MPDKTINQLDSLASIQGTDLLLVSSVTDDGRKSFKATAEAVKDYVESAIVIPDTFDALTAEHKGTTTGNLSGTTTVAELAIVVDGLTGGDNLGNHTATQDINLTNYALQDVGSITLLDAFTPGYSSLVIDGGDGKLKIGGEEIYTSANPPPASASVKEFCLPYSYLSLTKAFTTGLLGWGALEFASPYYGSAGGYYSASATLQNGTSYILLRLPPGANNFRENKALEFGIYASDITATNTKLDIYVYGVTSSASGKFDIWSQAAYNPGAYAAPTGFSVNRSSLTNIFQTVAGWNEANHRAIVIELESYSRNNHYTFVTHGAVNLLGE